MKQIEQAKAALQAAEEYLIADDVSVARLHLDRALAALSTIEGSGEPVALSALVEAVAEGMNVADDRNEDPMSWIQSCLQRVKGVSKMTDAERLPTLKLKPSPSLSVDEVEQKRKDICKRITEKWGDEVQINKIQEEALELALVLNQRNCPTKDPKAMEDALYDELADMKIMMMQVDMLFDTERIDKRVQFKFDRVVAKHLTKAITRS